MSCINGSYSFCQSSIFFRTSTSNSRRIVSNRSAYVYQKLVANFLARFNFRTKAATRITFFVCVILAREVLGWKKDGAPVQRAAAKDAENFHTKLFVYLKLTSHNVGRIVTHILHMY